MTQRGPRHALGRLQSGAAESGDAEAVGEDGGESAIRRGSASDADGYLDRPLHACARN